MNIELKVLAKPKMMGRYKRHKLTWGNCKACPLGERAHKHVFGRGRLPCHVMLVGEAPGDTENALGYPFCGKAGKLLQKAIDTASRKYPAVRWFLTNIVACRPCDDTDGPLRKPYIEEQTACSGRLADIVRLADPMAVVFLGKVAQSNHDRPCFFTSPSALAVAKHAHIRKYSTHHPSFVLRNGGDSSELYSELVKTLQRAFKECVT